MKQTVFIDIEVEKDFVMVICNSEIISEASKRSIKEREDILIAKGRGHVITESLRASWQAEIDKYSKIVQEEVDLIIGYKM